MNEFIENWHNDKKYQAKIKLLLYGLFIIFVTIIALSQRNNELIEENENNNEHQEVLDNTIIKIPTEYSYDITINIDDDYYRYYGNVKNNETTIIKENDNSMINYIYRNNEYYMLDGDIYIKTTKDEVYDLINYNYINLDNINNYLSKSVKSGNQYLVYLKDIILNDDTDEYLIININDNTINIDYTPLMRHYNSNISNYNVNITIENIEQNNGRGLIYHYFSYNNKNIFIKVAEKTLNLLQKIKKTKKVKKNKKSVDKYQNMYYNIIAQIERAG